MAWAVKTISLYEAQHLSGEERSQAYNAVDCIATGQIHDVLAARMSPRAKLTYQFEMACQLPAFAMTTRGILIDTGARDEALLELRKELRAAEKALNQLPEVKDVWDGKEKVTGTCVKSTRKDTRHTWDRSVGDDMGRTCVNCGCPRFSRKLFNPGSHPQVAHLLYDLLEVPKQYSREKGGKRSVTTDDRALDTIGRKWPRVSGITTAIAECRGMAKQMGFLKSRLTKSGRFASVFNVGAAWTGRWSSNKNPYGEGGNSQNIAERHRSVFVADPGMQLCYIDLKQAESNVVAHLAGDASYIEAHRTGDVHTYVCRLVWPDLAWTSDNEKDAKYAKSVFMEWDPAPGHNIRFQAKRLQHGSNYGLTPPGIAAIAHIPQRAARTMQNAYFQAFPHIKGWQRWIAERVAKRETLVNPLGVEVQLFGRPWDDHTVKQGLSYLPQSTVGHIVAIGARRIYEAMDPYKLQLLAQVHDALLFQFPAGDLDTVKQALSLVTIPCEVTDYRGSTRLMTIQAEAAVGLNWGKANMDPEEGPLNPNGMREVTQ